MLEFGQKMDKLMVLEHLEFKVCVRHVCSVLKIQFVESIFVYAWLVWESLLGYVPDVHR